jgi:hypothetical protein
MHVVTIMGSLLSIDSQTAESQTAELQTTELHDVRIELRLALEKQEKENDLSDAAFAELAELAIVKGENAHLRCRLDDLRFALVGANWQYYR